jgi:2-phosphoglycerate kinase
MINVCEKCGLYRNDKLVETKNSQIICPECGYTKNYKLLHLFLISGASGSGKSTICNYLTGEKNNYIVLDMDILLSKDFDKPEDNYKQFYETWLRMAKNISQAGRPVVLFGVGCIPKTIDTCIEKRYFKCIHYLGLTCSNDVLEKRLNDRPTWRNCSKEFIGKQIEYNNFLYEYANKEKKMKLLETNNITIEDAGNKINNWIESIIEKNDL